METNVAKLTKNKTHLILALFAFLSVFSCSEDNPQSELPAAPNGNQYPYKVQTVDYQSLQANHLLIDKLNQIHLADTPDSSTQSAKTVYLPQYDFYIDTDSANFLESTEGNYHSYTFNILPGDHANLDAMNLLLSYNGVDNGYDAYVVTYNITPQERISLSNNEHVALDGKITLTAISDFDPGDIMDSLVIYIDTESESVTCWEPEYGTSQGTGWDIIEWIEVICPWQNGGNGGGGNGDGDGGYGIPGQYQGGTVNGTGSFNGMHPGNNGGGPASAPSIKTLKEQRQDHFYKAKLNLPQKIWTISHQQEKALILEFLENITEENNMGLLTATYPQAYIDIALTILNTLMANPNMSFEEASLLFAADNSMPILFNPDDPITNVQEFLECFNINQNATLTIYAMEPNPGTGNTYNGTFVGHTFISISQGNNTSTYGFYPVEDNIYPVFNVSSVAVLGNDGSGNEPYTVSLSKTITGYQLQQIINASINFNQTYHLNNYNCTDFGLEIGNIGGFNLPNCNGTWPGGGGSNPGTLGMEIRNRVLQSSETRNTAGGNAPATQKNC